MVVKVNPEDSSVQTATSNFQLPLVGSLQNYYNQEVMAELAAIEQAVLKLQIDKDKLINLKQIRDTAHLLSDLAMIHGFEGVEKISEKLYSTMDHLLNSRIEFNQAMLTKLILAVNVIRQVEDMESIIESQMTVERIDRNVELKQRRVQNCAEQFSRSIDELMTEQLELKFVNKTSELLFDIVEQESVLSLVDESQLEKDDDKTLDLFTAQYPANININN